MLELSINTTQNVNISFVIASIGDRILAYLFDMLVKITYVFFIYYVFFYWLGIGNIISIMDDWSQTAITLLCYFPIMFYSLALESMLEGQTLGKKAMKIKVVKIDGYQATFGDYLMRWLFRIIDISTSSGIIGLFVMIFTKNTQRFGDVAAGTAVISQKKNVTIDHTILEVVEDNYIPVYPLVIRLTDNDVRIIKETFHSLKTNTDSSTIHRLCEKIEEVTGIKNQSKSEKDFIKTILKDYNFYTQNM